jgi:hypothetical protein
MVGDRGMITSARIEAIRALGGLGWITSLRAPAIRALAEGGALQLSLFDEADLAEITGHPDFPGERLVACRNPALAAHRSRKRDELLAGTEALLDPIVASVTAGRLVGADKIGLRVGKVINRCIHAVRSCAMSTSWSQASLQATPTHGRLRRPVSFAARMRFSTWAW